MLLLILKAQLALGRELVDANEARLAARDRLPQPTHLVDPLMSKFSYGSRKDKASHDSNGYNIRAIWSETVTSRITHKRPLRLPTRDDES
jgi:hypothetical protein